jgi:hypothetical protein
MRVVHLLQQGSDGSARVYATHMIFCPACKCGHGFRVATEGDPHWKFNGDLDKPTFEPSLVCRWKQDGRDHVCHSIVTNGQIQFLSDCTHALAGQTVALEPF